MKLRIIATAMVTGMLLTSAAMADAISDRKAMMKAVGTAAKAAAQMAKGQAPYDAVKAELAFRTMQAVALGIGSNFPDDSKEGGETTAAPAIWEDSAGFTAAMAKFASDAGGAVEPAKSEDGFKQAMGSVMGNCKSCHEKYRIKK